MVVLIPFCRIVVVFWRFDTPKTDKKVGGADLGGKGYLLGCSFSGKEVEVCPSSGERGIEREIRASRR